jgi:hypothetical protein
MRILEILKNFPKKGTHSLACMDCSVHQTLGKNSPFSLAYLALAIELFILRIVEPGKNKHQLGWPRGIARHRKSLQFLIQIPVTRH